MKIKILVNLLTLLMLAETTTACGVPSTYANNQPHSSPASIMTNLVKKVTLIAREQNLPPLGVPVDPQRNIGFASALIRLENPEVTPTNVTITKVEIRNLSDGKLQNFPQISQEIQLKPLENSEVVLQLTNKSGYAGQDKVKAIVTYEIDNQSSIIESDAVEVTR